MINCLIISLLIINVVLLLILNVANKKQTIKMQCITTYFQMKINTLISQIDQKQQLINTLQQNSDKLDKALKKLKNNILN